jgi:predicted nucleotidyltransferase
MSKRKPTIPGLIDIIASRNCINVLKLFLYRPKYELYQSEVIKRSGVSQNTTIKLLNMLTESGILSVEIKAGSKFYSLVLDNPVSKQLKVLITVTGLYDLTRYLADKNVEIYLFGSAARGEDTENSDIDLLVIGSIGKNSLSSLFENIRNYFQREVSPVIYTPIQYSNLPEKDRAFYESIEKDKIRVL